MSTPYLWPATWCDSGMQPFRWAGPWGSAGRWLLFSLTGEPPGSSGVRLTPTAAEPGVSSNLPRAREGSIITWCWVVDIWGRRSKREGLKLFVQKNKVFKGTLCQFNYIESHAARPTQCLGVKASWRWASTGGTSSIATVVIDVFEKGRQFSLWAEPAMSLPPVWTLVEKQGSRSSSDSVIFISRTAA